MVISTDVAAILDPHKRHTGLDRRGWDGDLDEFLSYDGHGSCFRGIFGLTRATRNYNATLFRFALRRRSSNSEIAKTEYPVERVRGFLYDSFIKEAPIIMLFLKYVQQISLYDNDQLVYKVSLEPSQMYAIKQEREALIKLAESGFLTCSLRVCSMTIITEDNRPGQTPTQSYHWLVMNMIGSTDRDILQLSQELEILPWVGVAAPLPQMATIGNLALPFCNTSNITSCVQQLQPGLRKVAMSLPWCEEVQGHSEGHVFCFLPLPNTTHLPINIHGYFAVSDNRRSIEWPASDNKSQKALWNKALLEKHVAPLYSILLACRTHLVKYAGTPLPVLGSERKITDPYVAWPLISRVRYQPIWNELVKPALHGAINVPLLWSPANNGRWVCLNEAYFLPVSPTFPLGEVAIEVLIRANMPVVSLPNDVHETLVECGQHFTMSQRSVQPKLVRQALRMMPPLSFNDKDSLQSLLECVLYDITQYNYNELVNLKLLPLNTSNFRVEVFKQKARTNDECVFVSDYQSNYVLKFLPGVESQIMDTSLHLSVQSKMANLAQGQVLQLRMLSPQVISSYLLSKSIQSWCPSYRLHQSITWCPGRNGHPSGEWISDVWTWLSRHQTTLPSVVGLPLVPQQLINSTSNSNVTLLPLPAANSGLYFVEKDREEALLANMLRKMRATVVSYNTFVFSHPSISQYILQINIHTVLQYISNAGISVISSLNNDEKSCLRVLIAQYYYSNRGISFAKLISQLPIFEVGVGANPVQLVSLHFRAYVLPEAHIEFDPSLQYPPNILSNREPVVVKLINKLGYGCQNNETLFISSILPFALQQCKASSYWSNGDELIVWMLNKMNSPPKSLLKVLQSEPFIRTKANSAVCKTASQLYDIKDEQFERLYDSSVDPVFPDDIYCQKKVMSKLMILGIVSWSSLIKDHPSLVSFMKERAGSVQLLQGEAAIQRSCYILELIVTNPRLINVLMSGLQKVCFLAVESSPPENYPSLLHWAGAGKKSSFDAPCNICHHNTNLYIIGSVLPVLSSYYSRNQIVCPPKVQEYFYSPSIQDVIKQLQILVNSVTRPITNVSEADKVSQLINNIYSYLNTHYSEVHPSTLPTKWIWWPNEQGHYMFMPTSSFVWRSPLPLNPLVHTVSSDLKMSAYGNLFARAGMRKTLSLAEIVDTLRAISSKFPIGQLPDHYLKMAIKIVKYLEENKYESSGDVLLPTTENRLCPAKDCTYDDREWIRQRVGAGVSKYKFVHGEIPPITAQYFGVEPLSKRIAPSEKLKLTYTKAGPKERVTRRISGIVNDYSGNIDVFKELIQNADDAGATEIKLLLDWRTHGKEYLFEQEMEHWQGPAVVAYNNATFSDQDFDNICELAAETKMKDPMKTGRFGVGFCASYSLTDVPSFVSRHFLTIFDPHTKYLGDRVSHNEPGIRINLVEQREGLAVYEDQFSPFNGLFGCNIFQLTGDGFNGTIFRFPLRMSGFPRSEISNDRYDRYAIEKLMKDLQKEASNLLLFLKHITSLEVLIIEEGVKSPKEMKVQFQIQKQSPDHKSRMQLMRNPHLNQKPVCSNCSIKVVDNVNCKDHMCQYLIASALSTTTEAKPGLVPLAELAISVSNDCPQSLENDGCLFCFLPLPLGSYLPFHVNGFFDVGKDRRGLKEADRSPEYHWNMSLIQNALPLALEHALSSLCKQMNLSLLKNDAKETCLKQYYSLWPGEYTATTGTGRQNWITLVFSQSVKKILSNSNEKLVWSEINGGKWVTPQSAFLFTGVSYLPKEILNEAIQLLLSHDYSIVKCPHHIHQLLKASLNETHLFNYERFFKEIFLPNISSIDVSIRNKHLLFVLTKLHEENNSIWKNFNWAIQPLKSTSCIPVDISGQLVRPEELIDTRYTPIAKLYDPEEGRFPDQMFRETDSVMNTLVHLEMITSELPIDELTERAHQVTVIGASDQTKANERMIRLLEYIDCIEKKNRYPSMYLVPSTITGSKRKERIAALRKIAFLRAASKPVEISIPWCTTEESFLMPSQLLSPQYFALVFTKRPLFDLPVTDNSMEVEKVVEYLGIDDNKPTVDDVLDHLCCLIEHFNDQMLDEKTIEFLEKEKIFPSIYEFLQSQTDKEAIKSRLSSKNCIWQNGRLLSPKQVLHSWEDKRYYPYLCSLSDSNLKFAEFFEVVGVMREATLDYLIAVLETIHQDNLDQRLPDELVDFVNILTKRIEYMPSFCQSKPKPEIFLPDKDGILRLASTLLCDSNLKEEWIAELPVYADFKAKGGHFIHPTVPRSRALNLGAYELIDAVMKEFEDDTFLNGTPFGQSEDLVDRLNGILKKYPADTSIFREFIQNADDAQATEIVFVLDHRVNHPKYKLLSDAPNWKKLQSTPALCVYNNRPFSEKDIQGICKLGRGGKGDTADTIGRFGIGFNVSYHLTDCPSFVSFASEGNPMDFCVFDPLRRYCKKTSQLKPGRRWKVNQSHMEQFPDQFQPFLVEQFDKMKVLSDCFEDTSQGYVVFRLPLIRHDPYESYYYRSTHSDTSIRNEKWFSEGKAHRVFDVVTLVKNFKVSSENMLLFLNHIKSISVFEIKKDGEINHHFTTSVTVDVGFTNLTVGSKGTIPKQLICETTITHQVENVDTDETISQWIISKRSGFSQSEQLSAIHTKAEERGLEAFGGVAAQLNTTEPLDGSLFCFLPMNISSYLPVHLNAHFLVDDSRKHLDTLPGLKEWNDTVARHLLVPAYIELILQSRSKVDGTTESITWFYNLFPKLMSSGEASQLNINLLLYQQLLRENHPVLLDARGLESGEVNWLRPRGSSNGLFCVSHLVNQIRLLQCDKEIEKILITLGMPITCAPHDIFRNYTKVSEDYTEVGLVMPDKVIQWLKDIDLDESDNEAVIKENCETLLQFCLQHCPAEKVQSTLKEVPLLLTLEDTLDKSGQLFHPKFSQLLPHCHRYFISPSLVSSKSIGKLLQEGNIIIDLPITHVATKIQLPDVNEPTKLSSTNLEVVKLLWQYLSYMQLYHPSTMADDISDHFSHKPILPTSGGLFYPPILGKCVFREIITHLNVQNVMIKLGYKQLDFKQIEQSLVPSYMHPLVSVVTSCDDILQCLQLCRPKVDAGLHFSTEEVNELISILNQSDSIPDSIATDLKKLPLFETVDGSYICMSNASKFYIKPLMVPNNGILTIQEATKQVVFKIPNISTEQFYKKIISADDYALASERGVSGFYLQFLIPNFSLIKDADLLVHLTYLCFNIVDIVTSIQLDSKEWLAIIEQLKITPIITKDGKRHKVSSFCDPKVQFHATFQKSKLPPSDWCTDKWLPFLRLLGLQTAVSTEIWIVKAKKVGDEIGRLQKRTKPSQELIDKTAALMTTFKGMIYHYNTALTTGTNTNNFRTFLVDASKIPFLYHPEPYKLAVYVEHITGQAPVPHEYFIRFHEAVYHKSEMLSCLVRHVLPGECDFLADYTMNPIISKELSIREPLNCKAVVKNLIALSKSLSGSAAKVFVPTQQNELTIRAIKRAFESHYQYLEKHLDEKVTQDLRREQCILLSPNNTSFQLVKPNQLVLQLPQGYDFQPFCYRTPPELLKYGSFLKNMGIQQDLTPLHYIEMLASIKGEMERAKKKLSEDQHFKEVCENAYKCLIVCLRSLPEPPQLPNSLTIYLPSESFELTESSQLVHNDVPWIATRLQKSQHLNYKFILSPPTDENGQTIPPPSLRVKLISELAVEKLHNDVKLRVNKCTEQELYDTKKHAVNCKAVEILSETFQSRDFRIGIGRLYWHKTQKHPNTNKSFCKRLKELTELNILCVNEIKTIIHFNQTEIKETEDSSRLCYFVKGEEKLQLYVTHKVSHFSEEKLFEQLAQDLSKHLEHRIGDAMHLKAILQCYPSQISSVLDQREISPFDPKLALTETSGDQEIGAELILDDSGFEKEDLLIMCNYSNNEKVVYHFLKEGQPVFQYAKIVECPPKTMALLKDKCVKLQIGKTPKGEPITKDASLLQVYKLLDTSQRTTLSGGQSSAYTTPITLAVIPEQEEDLYKWIKDTLVLNGRSCCCSMSQLSLRLVAHMHYLLVTRNVSHDLFLLAAKRLVVIMKDTDTTLGICDPDKEIEEVKSLVRDLEQLSIKDDDVFGEPQSPLLVETIPTSISYKPQSPPISAKRRLFSTPIHTPSSSSQPAINVPSQIPAYRIAPASSFASTNTGSSRVNQGFYSGLRNLPRFMPLQRQADDVQVPPQPKTSIKDAEMWLQQAKADYLAARNLYMCQGTEEEEQRNEIEENEEEEENEEWPIEEMEGESEPEKEEQVQMEEESDKESREEEETEQKLTEDEDEVRKQEEEDVRRKPDTQIYCKFPALVCFLSHDVVEKCIKGIMYAKCGLPTNLLESSHLLTLCEQLERSDHCAPQLKNVVKECVLRVNEHSNKSRYPNYQVPPCAPASIYTSLEAEEAITAAYRLIQEIKKDDVLDEIIGDLEDLPEQRFSSLLSVIFEGRGKNQ